jgi:hypothetical protein
MAVCRSRLRWLLGGVLVLGIAVLVSIVYAFWSLCLSTHYSAPGLRLSYETGGTRNAVSFDVRDPDGQPIAGVSVLSEDYSGSVWGVTDGNGIATNVHTSGESTVLSVTVNGQRVEFRTGVLIEDLFSPDLSSGVRVTVVLQPE